MDIFFTDPSEIPLPPHEVRILNLRAEPWPDGRRVRVAVEVSPFQKRPNLDLKIQDAQGAPAASVTIIESLDRRMEMTMHLRGSGGGPYRLAAVLFYSEVQEAPEGEEQKPVEPRVVDEAEITFQTPE